MKMPASFPEFLQNRKSKLSRNEVETQGNAGIPNLLDSVFAGWERSTMNKISLLVVEDNEVYSRILLDIFGKDENIQRIELVRTAEDGLEKLGEIQVDLVLATIGLPGMDGITFVQLVHDQHPSLPCVMISGFVDPHYLQESLRAGARGYLLKENFSAILEGIWCVIQGGTYVSKELGEADPGAF
jgi:two-component system response regulator DesR